VSRPKTTKAPSLLLNLTRRPLLSGRWKQLNTAFYGVGRFSNPNFIYEDNTYRLGKMGARRPPSAKLLILQGECGSINSTAARDVTVCRGDKENGVSEESIRRRTPRRRLSG
jgi:hypothetical protein